ncbi:MAG: GGDEF domain-containing protein [Candidatus Adiutrix sp.]|jgi:diguanylate cyclase (GGDEF)-like protein|nr:GGDEF domain-containing protein [Candidatus Adiutrix sp.]
MKKPDQNPAAALSDRVLRALDMVVLKQVQPGQYQFGGLAPDFYSALFPAAANGSPCASPWDFSPMLDFFLGEAETFFLQGAHGVKSSGYWLEGDQEVPLLATALRVDGNNLIIIHAAREDYNERTRILRQARNELLARQKVTTDLNKYKDKALHDALTKLYSRGAFADILKDRLAAGNTFKHRAQSPDTALLMLDVDHFKYVNDDFGHLTGDAVLIQLGEILMSSLRANDIPVRYGGEEFMVIAPNTNLKQAMTLAEKLRQMVSGHDFGLGRPVTVSIGCAVHHPGDDTEKFVSRVDQALYEAKNSGRNRVCGRE